MPIISHGHWESAFPKIQRMYVASTCFHSQAQGLPASSVHQPVPACGSEPSTAAPSPVSGRQSPHTAGVASGGPTGMRLSFPLSSLGPGVAFGEVLFAPSYSWPCPGLSALLSHWSCGEFPLLMLSASREAIPKTFPWVSSTPAGHMGSPFCSADSSSS